DWSRTVHLAVTEDVYRAAASLAERHALKPLDSLHLASFLSLRRRLPRGGAAFSSFDRRLKRAALQARWPALYVWAAGCSRALDHQNAHRLRRLARRRRVRPVGIGACLRGNVHIRREPWHLSPASGSRERRPDDGGAADGGGRPLIPDLRR